MDHVQSPAASSAEDVGMLRQRLRDAEVVLEAIHNGKVDGILASSPGGNRLYTLEGAERIYQTIMERMSEGALALTADGVVLSANPRFAQMMERPIEQVFGAVFWDYLLPEDVDRCRSLLSTSTTDFKAELRLVGSGGAQFPALVSFSVLELDAHRCIFAVVTDLSELKVREEALQLAHDTLEQQVQQRTAELRASNEELLNEIRERRNAEASLLEVENRLIQYSSHLEALVEQRTRQVRGLERQRATMEQLAAAGRMAARVAHEINNPLAGIKNAIFLLKDAIPPDHKYAHYVPRIQKEIERIAAIVRQMFDLCKPPGEKSEWISAGGVLREVASLHKTSCDLRSITLDLEIDPSCAESAVPAYALRQILHALIQNAVEASPTGGRIRVTAAAIPEALVRYTVTDEGPGIPEERLTFIFEPFYTTKNTHREMGLGLGLSICRTLIHDACGTIAYRPSETGGSIFTVELPLASRAISG